jgi:hypothetical protein
MGRIGHGELHIEWSCTDIAVGDEREIINGYTDYLKLNADAVKSSLMDLFDEPVKTDADEKKKPAKRASKKSTDDKTKQDALKATQTDLDFFGATPED